MLDALAYMKAARSYGIPAALEVPQSGRGAHVRIFFAHAISASVARTVATSLLGEAFRLRGSTHLSSYDRLFPVFRRAHRQRMSSADEALQNTSDVRQPSQSRQEALVPNPVSSSGRDAGTVRLQGRCGPNGIGQSNGRARDFGPHRHMGLRC
jgi:hypothetical protein